MEPNQKTTEKKPISSGKTDEVKKNKKTVKTVLVNGHNVNIDVIILEIRKIMPMNRTKLSQIAIAELLKGRTVQDVAKIAMTYRKADDIKDLGNTIIA